MIQASGNVPHIQLAVDRHGLIGVGVCAEVHVLGRLVRQQIPHAAAYQSQTKTTLAKSLSQFMQLRSNRVCDIHHLRTHLRNQKRGSPPGMFSCTRGKLCVLLQSAMSTSSISTCASLHTR